MQYYYIIQDTVIILSVSTEAALLRALGIEILMDGVFSIERPVEYGSFSFVPIVIHEPYTEQDFMNTAEAIEADCLKILETAEEVESVLAKNIGDRPVLIEAAEVLCASGSQDRIVLQSTIVRPGEEVRLPVKCVHAPHPLVGGSGLTSSGAAGEGVRSSIQQWKYVSIMTDVVNYSPAGAVDQGEVWSKVGRYCIDANTKDPEKYVEALQLKRNGVKGAAELIWDQLPENTCGLVVIQREDGVRAFELYRSPTALRKRTGFIESLLMDAIITDSWPLESEAAWSTAVQFFYRLGEIPDESVVGIDGSNTLQLSIDNLVGEAVLPSSNRGHEQAILYCTLTASA
jgi:hypothetical protein